MIRLQNTGMDRILKEYKGDILANSAGALLMFRRYLVTPNWYYPRLAVGQGLGILDWDAFLEVHYDPECQEQVETVKTAAHRWQCPVYALTQRGMIVFDEMGQMVDWYDGIKIDP